MNHRLRLTWRTGSGIAPPLGAAFSIVWTMAGQVVSSSGVTEATMPLQRLDEDQFLCCIVMLREAADRTKDFRMTE